MTPAMKLKVFIKPGCPWCVEAVAWLKREGYAFEEIDVLADAAAFEEMIRISGQPLAPTMIAGDDLVLADFGVPELEAFLEEHEIHP